MGTDDKFTIGNVKDSSKYKPQDIRYNNSWIEFWQSKVGVKRPQNCCVVDCKHGKPISQDDIVGGHVYVSTELSSEIEADLKQFCNYPSLRELNGFHNNNGYWYKSYGGLYVIMRCGNELVKTTSDCIVLIAPICNSCNQMTGEFTLKNNTILVPLFWSDQKEVKD